MNYFKNETDYPLLKPFKENYEMIKKEYSDFMSDPMIRSDAFVNMSTAQKSIRSNKVDWKVFGLVMHFKKPVDVVRENNLSFNGISTDQVIQFGNYITSNHFKETQILVGREFSKPENRLISVWFSKFEPGTKLGLHVNYDPYMYRAHLGIDVPEGNIGFKVCDETIKWKEGEILVFDSTNPHTAWNLTDKSRTVLIIDFWYC